MTYLLLGLKGVAQLVMSCVLMFVASPTWVSADDCYMHLERDGFPCDDGDANTNEDQCYRGVCGGWRSFPSIIATEIERENWIKSDETLNDCRADANYIGCPPVDGCNSGCCRELTTSDSVADSTATVASVVCAVDCANCPCLECLGADLNYKTEVQFTTTPESLPIWPMYLALENDNGNGGGHLHGEAATEDAVYSFMKWKHPNIRWTKWRAGLCADEPGGCDMRGRALFKLDGTIRSEIEREVKGYKTVDVFQEASRIKVTNVRTHSSLRRDGDPAWRPYSAAQVRIGQPYYSDRDYILKDLPDFLLGLEGVQTAEDDKHSDAADTEFLCFDISERAAVYVLYDRRVVDHKGSPPAWLNGPNSMFTNEHIATVSTTDENMGFFNLYYQIFEKGNVCLGGNDEGSMEKVMNDQGNMELFPGSNYLVLVGPVTDLTMHPTHRVKITDLLTHSCPNGDTVDGTASFGQPGAANLTGKLCCFEKCGVDCGNWDCGGSGAGTPGNTLLLPCPELTSLGKNRHELTASYDAGGCVCPPGAYVGQRNCAETVDLHQTADGKEVLGGDYIISEIGIGDPFYVDRSYTATGLPPFLQYLNGIRTAVRHRCKCFCAQIYVLTITVVV
jgi:hypothetical protein